MTLTVVDPAGLKSSKTTTATIANAAPTVEAGPDQRANEGSTVRLAPTTFNDTGTLDTHIATIDWGDGTRETGMVDQEAKTVSGSHVYPDNGFYTLTVCVTDDDDAQACDTLVITVNNVASVVNAGPDQQVHAGDTLNVSITFSDPGVKDGPWSYSINWDDGMTDGGSTRDQSAPIMASHLYTTPGMYIIIACITDKNSDNGCDSQRVTVQAAGANQPPSCPTTRPSVASLWPPNHKFMSIKILGVTDPEGHEAPITITGIRQDEPVDPPDHDDGSFAPDGKGVGTNTAQVRAERAGSGNGRVYHIFFTAQDGQGGTCAGEVLVGVPHDQGQGSVPVDDGALYDSTKSKDHDEACKSHKGYKNHKGHKSHKSHKGHKSYED